MEKNRKIGKTKVCKTLHKLCLYHLKLILSPKPKDHLLLHAARPLISLPAGPIYAESGKDVKLPLCQVIGYPPAVVSWSKLFDQIPGGRATVKGHTLTISKTDKKDSGAYICTASNAMGTTHSVIISDSQCSASVYCQATREDLALPWRVSDTKLFCRRKPSTQHHLDTV